MSNANTLSKVNEPIRVLRKIKAVYPTAIIAGGYHRDIYNNKEYSDVDIYVDGSKHRQTEATDTSFWKELLGLKTDDYKSGDYIEECSETDEDYDAINNDSILAVFELCKNQISYNVIVIARPPIEYVIEEFDFGLCKVYCDGEKVSFTKEFMTDVEQKTLTFTDRKVSKANYAHAMSVHLTKLQLKYPNHKVVIPEIHKETTPPPPPVFQIK